MTDKGEGAGEHQITNQKSTTKTEVQPCYNTLLPFPEQINMVWIAPVILIYYFFMSIRDHTTYT